MIITQKEIQDRKIKEEIFNKKNENLKKIEQLFPSVVKDGQVDFMALKEELGEFEEVRNEKYGLNWTGKQEAKKVAQEDVINKTLKYVPEESKNADTTENLYIEGENLEVLKLLRQNYYNAIKMIYIDPPYNTGNDFIYNDDYSMSSEESGIQEGNNSELDERYTVNQKSSDKYHSNWLNMMYARIKVAKDLLKDDGVIFISIANEEQSNLKKICDEIFGEENFIETFIWTKTSTPPSLSTKSRKTVEYILCYEKYRSNNKYKGELLDNGDTPLLNSGNNVKVLEFPSGKIKFNIEDGIYNIGTYEKVELLDKLIVENGVNKNTVRLVGEFKWTQERLEEEIKEGTYFLIKSNKFSIRFQRSLRELDYKTPTNFICDKHIEIELNSSNHIGTNETAGKELASLGLKAIFDYTKPISLIKYLLKFITEKNDIILDFFSGSSTTAHAIMKLNEEDNNNRKFIMIQLPEKTDENSEAFKAGYKNICEIGKERIRRAGDKIKEENKDKEGIENLDIGFKVFKVGNTNLRWNNYNNMDVNQISLEEGKMSDKDKIDFMPDTKDIDVVYEILLRQRDIPLSSKVQKLSEIGDRTYIFAESFVVCLEENITEDLINKLVALNPLPVKFYFRDSAFNDDIDLKDYSIRELEALIAKNTGDDNNSYTVEFI